MTHDDIRNRLIQQINNNSSEFNGSYNAVAGGSGELIISERNAGDTFSVSRSVFSGDTSHENSISPQCITIQYREFDEFSCRNAFAEWC